MGQKSKVNPLTVAVQESLLALLCFDGETGKAVRAMVPIEAYDPYQREIVQEVYAYIDKYRIPPDQHTVDIFEGLVNKYPDAPDKREARDTIFTKILQELFELKGTINKEYVLSKAKNFARRQHAKATMQRVMPLMYDDKEGSIDEIEALFAGAAKTAQDLSDPGILFNDTSQALRFLNEGVGEVFPTGIPELDEYGVGPARKQYLLIEGESNTGKSWAAIHLGRVGILNRYRVLHVTLEMSEDKVSQRYVQAFAAVSNREAKIESTRFTKDSLGRVSQFSKSVVKRPTLRDENIRKLLKKKLEPLANKSRLYIKGFGSGTLTIPRLKSYLDYMEAVQGIIFDLMIVDMPDLMSHDVKFKRNELNRLAVEIRGIADERNMATVGLSQVNEAKSGNVIKMGRSHEGRGKEHTADIILTLNQTEAEYGMGLMRLFVAKNRDETKNIKVLISQSLKTGQFCTGSALMREKDYWSLLGENGSEGEDGS